VKAHRVIILGLGAWAYGVAAAGASYAEWPVAALAFAACSLTCAGLMIVGGRR
jgi:hypothetical protein